MSHEVDLSNANANDGVLRAALQPYVTVARRTGGRRVKLAVASRQSTDDTSKEPQTFANQSTTDDIRSWAQNNGHKVASHGRQLEELAKNPNPIRERTTIHSQQITLTEQSGAHLIETEEERCVDNSRKTARDRRVIIVLH